MTGHDRYQGPLVHLILGIHCHQPLGNFDHVIEEACDRGYLPFLRVLARHPDVPFNVHYSGSLLQWLAARRPDVLEALEGLGEQVEWMSGGFHEPILLSIPHRDRMAQIERLSRYLTDRFGRRPRGMWLTERVWDPALPEALAEVGMEYLPLDDYHFLAAGYPPEQLTGHFVADYQGSSVAIFPISQRLRYTIPFEEPEVTLRHLRRLHEADPDQVAVMADDGEKFGVWPGTHEWVYGEEGWLERFLRALEDSGDWLRPTTFNRYLDSHPPRGRVAIPPASYFEMTEWALPAESGARLAALVADLEEAGLWERARPFLRGGYWPNFQIKYPESNVMYRKMLRLSSRLAASRQAPEQARLELMAGQQNCPYWHGIFGGLYLPHLRAEVHRRLIRGRSLLDQASHRSRRWTELEVLDWDGDGREELHVELAAQSWVLDPAEGGALLYFDDKPAEWAAADVVSRRFEAYHPSLAEGGSISRGEAASIHERPATGGLPPIERFVYDRHPRRWLVDHLLDGEVDPAGFGEVEHEELLDLPHLAYRLEDRRGRRGRAVAVLQGRPAEGASIRKEVSARGRSLTVQYRVAGLPPGRFGPELAVSVWEGAGWLRAGRAEPVPAERPLAMEGRRFVLEHRDLGVSLAVRLSPAGALFCAPLRTISKSEAAYDDILQGVILWPHWPTDGSGRYRMTLEVGDA